MDSNKYLLTLWTFLIPLFLSAQKDSVLVKEASYRYEYTEFVLEKVTKKQLIKIASSSNYQFEAVTETVEIKPSRVKCVITEPVYKTVVITEKVGEKKVTYEKQVLVKKATIQKIEIPAEYGVLVKYVIKGPDGGVRPEDLIKKKDVKVTSTPAEYKTFDTWKLKEKTTVKKVEIPAVYKVID